MLHSRLLLKDDCVFKKIKEEDPSSVRPIILHVCNKYLSMLYFLYNSTTVLMPFSLSTANVYYNVSASSQTYLIDMSM